VPGGRVLQPRVANDGHNGVRITSGTVQEFASGVLLFSARTNGLSHLSTVENVLSGILLAETVRTRVRESVASGNAGPDSGVGITLFRSHNNRITKNTAVDNAELGIHLIQSDRNCIRNNRVRDNPEDGIILQGDRTARIVRSSSQSIGSSSKRAASGFAGETEGGTRRGPLRFRAALELALPLGD
jgi:parallel beta-helix repeat protein